VSAVKWTGINKPLVFRVKIRFVLKSFYDSDWHSWELIVAISETSRSEFSGIDVL